MALLAGNNPIVNPDDYDVPTLPGQEYLLCVKGTGVTGSLAYYDQNLDDFATIDNGDIPGADGETEFRIVAPSRTLRITITDAGTVGAFVTLVPLL